MKYTYPDLPWLDLPDDGLPSEDALDNLEEYHYFTVLDFIQVIRDCGAKTVLDTMKSVDPDVVENLFNTMYDHADITPEERCVLLNKKC